jgi:long-chain fatty acid transport protein
MSLKRPSVTKRRSEAAILALCAGAVAAGPAVAGGLTAYEIGTADVGLASAGYGARAQDASTVLTNPAGMTRLDGAQVLAAGQVLWGSTKFSVDSGTSPLLGSGDGGYAVGSGGWFLGGGPFMSHSLSPDLKLGFAVAGNFGAPFSYDDNWAGRYYVQKGTLLGISLLPAIAYRVTDKLSMGASLNAMYGVYKNEVAINNVGYPDGQLKLDDNSWGWGGNLGLLYEIDAGTRVGLTWNSQVSLDFKAPLQFSGLSPGLTALLAEGGVLGSQLKVGIKVPQQVMASLFNQVNDRWAMLGSSS